MSREKEIEALRKDLGVIDLTRIDSVSTISTGIVAIDLALGGGFPEGRFSEVYGDWQSGKSLLLYQTIAQCQRGGGICILLDVERSLDPVWIRALGINMKELLYYTPVTLEEAFDDVETAVKTIRRKSSIFKNSSVLIGYDSLAASVAKDEFNKSFGQPEMAIRARVISSSLRRLVGLLADQHIAFILVNQLRSKIGVMFGPTEETTGGRAPKFYASLRVSLRKRGQITKDGKVVGVKGELVTVKSRIGVPFKSVPFSMMFSSGIDRFSGLIVYLEKYGIIKKSGPWIAFGKHKMKTTAFLKSWDSLSSEVIAKLKESSVAGEFEDVVDSSVKEVDDA